MSAAAMPEGLEHLVAMLEEVAGPLGAPANPAMRRIYQRMVKEHPGEPDAWLLMANMHRDDGAHRPLAMAARRAVRLGPQRSEVLLTAADHLLAAGELDEAGSLLDRARALRPTGDHAWAAHLLMVTATFHEAHGEPDAAEQAYREAVETVPEDSYLWFLLASFLGERGRIREAREVASVGLSRFPADDALANLARDLDRR